MEINYWAVLAGALASMVIGFLWYGPLFGKKWIEINGLSTEDITKREAMQKEATPLYFIQFGLSLLQLFILSLFISFYYKNVNFNPACAEMGQCFGIVESAMVASFFIWLGFVMPTVAGLSMWNMQPTKVRLALFFISSGYQLVSFVVFGWILGTWG